MDSGYDMPEAGSRNMQNVQIVQNVHNVRNVQNVQNMQNIQIKYIKCTKYGKYEKYFLPRFSSPPTNVFLSQIFSSFSVSKYFPSPNIFLLFLLRSS